MVEKKRATSQKKHGSLSEPVRFVYLMQKEEWGAGGRSGRKRQKKAQRPSGSLTRSSFSSVNATSSLESECDLDSDGDTDMLSEVAVDFLGVESL